MVVLIRTCRQNESREMGSTPMMAKEEASTESDEEEKREGGEGQDKGSREKRYMPPRRKFEWNQEIR